MKLSTLTQQIQPSLTLSITAKAKEMKKQGVDVISFAAGEPDFDTLSNVKNAAKKAIDEGFTKYTPTSGIPELKQAIINKVRKDHYLKYRPTEVLVSNGAKQALFNIIMALIDKDDEVLIPVPYWVSYKEMIKIAGGKVVFVKSKTFKVSGDLLEKYLSPKTKMLILNSPNNPTGIVYEEKDLKDIAKFCLKHNIIVLSDEIYEGITYEKTQHSIAEVNEKIKNLTIIINGVSKTYAMTGWRIGYALGSEEVIKAATRIQDHTTSNPCSISQKAALEALTGLQDHLPKLVNEYKKRRDFMLKKLGEIKNIFPIKPEGAFYVFVNVSKLYNQKVNHSMTFCEKLLEEAKIACIPGIAFGDDNYIRLSFATNMINIDRGLTRLKNFCQTLLV